MKPCPVSSPDLPEVPSWGSCALPASGSQSFDNALEEAGFQYRASQSGTPFTPFPDGPSSKIPALSSPELLKSPPPTGTAVAAAYQRHAEQFAEPANPSSFQKYKDDQLLRNPGGRNYFLDENRVAENSSGQSVLGLIKKDLSDAFGNIRYFFGNMLQGAPVLYRNEKNEIQQGRQRGLLQTIADFCQDLGSALSFGAWHPGSTDPPHGFKDRLLFFASKLKDAFLGDLLTGVPSCANHMGKNLLLSGWHLAEVMPDAAAGGFSAGQKLTTTIFDNGHVAIEYLTDIIPSGDAWLRVHASNLKELKPPVLYNLKMPEHYKGDIRWEHVRNTPYRKAIETIGALLTDALTIAIIGQTGCSSNRRNQVEY